MKSLMLRIFVFILPALIVYGAGSEHGALIHSQRSNPAAVKTPDLVLWDNSDISFIGDAILSMELGGLPASKRLMNLADEVIVPENVIVTVSEVMAQGMLGQNSSQPDSFAVILYKDDNGKPGDLLVRRNVVSTTQKQYPEVFTLLMDKPIIIGSGTYWFSIAAMFNSGKDKTGTSWYWATGANMIGSAGYGQDETGLNFGIPYKWMRADAAGMVNSVSGWFVILGSASGKNGGIYPLFYSNTRSGHAPLSTVIMDFSVYDPADPIKKWSWDLNGDGMYDSQINPAQWQYTTPGSYDVNLIVANSTNVDTVTEKGYIRVFDGESSLEFDGATSYSTNVGLVAPTANLNLTETFTLEAWFKPQGFGPYLYNQKSFGYGRILDKYIWTILIHDAGDYGYPEKSLVVDLTFPDNSYVDLATPKNSIKLNEWQHVAVTFNAASKNCQIYLNGIAQSLTPFNGTIKGALADNSAEPLIIGNRWDFLRTFDGSIDEVRIWNVVRTQEQIASQMGQRLAGAEPGLVAYYPLNEGSGSLAKDLAGKSNDAVIYNALWDVGVFKGAASAVQRAHGQVVEDFVLEQNFPNPFNPTTIIPFNLGQATRASLRIFDVMGRELITLLDDRKAAGQYEVQWDGKDKHGNLVANGVYIYVLETQGANTVSRSAKKLILVK